MLAARPPIVHYSPSLRSRWAVALGCHGNPDRCLAVGPRRTGVCARCLGFLVGNLVAAALFATTGLPSPGFSAVGLGCLVPALVDGSLQGLTADRSTALRRLGTGVLGGFGQILLLGGFVAKVLLR
jgi:uncharacterized membrane protein